MALPGWRGLQELFLRWLRPSGRTPLGPTRFADATERIAYCEATESHAFDSCTERLAFSDATERHSVRDRTERLRFTAGVT